MGIYTVSITDGTTLSSLAVSAGRGPTGKGWTGVSYDTGTGRFTFTSNDGLGYVSDDITVDLDAAVVAAEAAQTGAAAAAAATEALFNQFGDQYLGPKASDPTVDNDGDPLTQGDIYFNTTDSVLKFYSGSAWVAPESTATNAALAAQAAQAAAQTAEANAETAETNADASASNAATSASNAATSASNAATSATAAATSATAAAASATAAAASAASIVEAGALVAGQMALAKSGLSFSGFLECDGSSYDETLYPNLAAAGYSEAAGGVPDVIDLGATGQLIFPIDVGGKYYYYFDGDKSGTPTTALAEKLSVNNVIAILGGYSGTLSGINLTLPSLSDLEAIRAGVGGLPPSWSPYFYITATAGSGANLMYNINSDGTYQPPNDDSPSYLSFEVPSPPLVTTYALPDSATDLGAPAGYSYYIKY